MKRPSVVAPADLQILWSLQSKYGATALVRALKAKPRGRPKQLFVGQAGLVLSIDWMVDAYCSRGVDLEQARRQAKKDAMEALSREDARGRPLPDGQIRAIDMSTLNRYYRQGVTELRDGEIRLALETDVIAAQKGVKGIDLAKAGFDAGAGGVPWLRYLRGKAAIQRRSKQDK